MLNILNMDPPRLPAGKFDPKFSKFIESCLQKQASSRPTVQQLFDQHKEWFSKAKDAAYLREHFLKSLPDVDKRID